jgi:hypothetical protein
MRLQPREIDLDHLVEVGRRIGQDFRIGGEQMGVMPRLFGQSSAVGRPQIGLHPLIPRKDRGGGPEFRPHVGDRSLARAADRPGAGSEVFDDPIGSPLDGQMTRQIEDDILRRCPAVHIPGEVHADQLRVLHFPRKPGHDVHGVRAAHAGREHAQPAGVGRVRVGADHHPAGKGVVLQNHLVNDAGSRLPESDAVLPGGGGEEGVDLAILLLGLPKIGSSARAGLNQVIAVDRGRDGGARDPRAHELEDRHLGGGVLHGHPIGP